MEYISTSLIDSFTQFLSEKASGNKVKIQGNLISFAAEVDFIFENKLNTILRFSENSFFFFSTLEDISFAALDSVYSINENGPARFTATDKKIKELYGKIISNWSDKKFPLFVGAMKFTVEHSDEDWKDFNDSNWFIPEIILCRMDGKTFLIYNYYAERGFSIIKLTEKFSKRIEALFRIKEDKDQPVPRIINSNGLTPKDKKKWKQVINSALEKIHNLEIKKIVLSRKVELVLSANMNLTLALNSLKEDYPDCFLFAYHKNNSTFFGATPELLAKISDDKIELNAIAGSAERSLSPEDDIKFERELLNSKKNLDEHSYVIEHLKETLKNISGDIIFDNTPSVKKLKNIQHLYTHVSASLKDDITVMNILKEVHPTPAVCGYPKEAALNLIKKTENQRRGLYAGILGWFNLNKQGEFVVSIRSALEKGNKLTAYAGGGIVEGSEPDAEFEETEMKLKPILSLFSERSLNEKKD